MNRIVSSRTGLVLLALALLVPVALPGVAAVEGNDAEGEATVTGREDGREEPEPPRNRTLTLTFTSNETGKPLADLPVKVANRWHPDDGRRGASDRWFLETDGNGSLAVNVSDGPVRVGVDDPDWKVLHARFEVDGDLDLELEMRPTEEDTGRIRGAVYSEDGHILPNASIEVEPVRDCEGDRCTARTEPRRETGEDDTRRVVDGTEVRIRWENHDRHVYRDTDEGTYEVAVPPGTYRVEARAPDHLRASEVVEVPEGGEANGTLELTAVPPDSVTLEGVVRNAETGEAVPGAIVHVENPRWGTHEQVRTGEDGSYEVAVKPGHLLVRVRAQPGTPGHCWEDASYVDERGAVVDRSRRKEDCEAGPTPEQAYLPWVRGLSAEADETVTRDAALQPEPEPTATIQGWVLEDGTDEPLENATVRFYNEETGDWGRARVDENGSFAAQVPAGYHTIRVRAPGHLENATNVAVDEGETAEVVLRAPAGEPARGTRHYQPVEPVTRSHETGGDARGDAGHGDAEAAMGADGGASSGEAETQSTIQAGPGGLGSYEASGGDPHDPPRNGAAAPGIAAVVLTLAAGAAMFGRPS